MNSPSITVKRLRAEYINDMKMYEQDAHGDLITAIVVPEAGLCWPLDWLKDAPEELIQKWAQFMTGQTYCHAGFYERDVRRFLFGVCDEYVSKKKRRPND